MRITLGMKQQRNGKEKTRKRSAVHGAPQRKPAFPDQGMSLGRSCMLGVRPDHGVQVGLHPPGACWVCASTFG